MIVLVGLLYAYIVYAFDATTLLVSVVSPPILGSIILSVRKRWIFLFGFLAYFWSVVDDAPVYFDSVLTWPEVTRFHPFLPRLYMNIVLHLLTLVFLCLAIWLSMEETDRTRSKVFKVSILALLAFILAYAQNIPLTAVQDAEENSWYAFDVAEKVASIGFFVFAVREAKKSKTCTDHTARTSCEN